MVVFSCCCFVIFEIFFYGVGEFVVLLLVFAFEFLFAVFFFTRIPAWRGLLVSYCFGVWFSGDLHFLGVFLGFVCFC